jgi:GrpB-like predicted nucleotidyltransferase (UPF0157 family)
MKKIFCLQQWSPAITATAHDVINVIHHIAPELEVLFMGAAALGLPGKNDIDLDILCKKSDVKRYGTLLLKVLGKPKEVKNDMVFWEFNKNGFEVDCILSDPAFSHVPEQKQVFDALNSNSKLLGEYKQLKISCDGLEYDEYEKRKKSFFAKVLANQE